MQAKLSVWACTAGSMPLLSNIKHTGLSCFHHHLYESSSYAQALRGY